MVEFRYDPHLKRYWILEVNPRVWGSIALPVGCGVDFPYWLYLCAVGEEDRARALAREFRDYPLGRVARWVLGDIAQVLRALARGRPGAAWAMLRGPRANIRDDLHFDDPGAFMGECASYIAQALFPGSR